MDILLFLIQSCFYINQFWVKFVFLTVYLLAIPYLMYLSLINLCKLYDQILVKYF